VASASWFKDALRSYSSWNSLEVLRGYCSRDSHEAWVAVAAGTWRCDAVVFCA